MSKQIYVNLPISDLERSTAFYEALGFTKVPGFSNDLASGMKWSDNIFVMLLTPGFYGSFLKGQTIADTHATNAALLCLSLDSKDEVQQFADTAKANGGDAYVVDMGMPRDVMFGYEVLDPDGNHWEPLWMDPNHQPPTA